MEPQVAHSTPQRQPLLTDAQGRVLPPPPPPSNLRLQLEARDARLNNAGFEPDISTEVVDEFIRENEEQDDGGDPAGRQAGALAAQQDGQQVTGFVRAVAEVGGGFGG